MKRVSYFPFVLIVGFLFFIMSLSKDLQERSKYFVIEKICGIWEKAEAGKIALVTPPTFNETKEGEERSFLERKKLQLENELLRSQAEGFYEWLSFEQRIDEQIEAMKAYGSEKKEDLYWNEFFRRRAEEIKKIISYQIQALPGKVIFREPSNWSSSIWINIGEKDNETLGKLVIAKNSPVVLGNAIVGAVDFVGNKYSRVRLITDSGLVLSVRAVRGNTQNRALYQITNSMNLMLFSREELFNSLAEKEQFFNILNQVLKKLTVGRDDYYLAKGELFGSSSSLWRSKDPVLKGVGFNYDFADAEGPKRDLRTGQVRTAEKNDNFSGVPLLKMGDLLITSGLDGIFPPGFHVAMITKIKDLNEGAYGYEIEARPIVNNLNELEMVFVLPPFDFEGKDQ